MDCRELDELGLEEGLQDGALLIEWPERAPSRIPGDALWIEMEIAGESERRMKIYGCSLLSCINGWDMRCLP